ncbi:hypothetical protein IWQ57_006811, partial [Coemansia nantahalensis]
VLRARRALHLAGHARGVPAPTSGAGQRGGRHVQAVRPHPPAYPTQVVRGHHRAEERNAHQHACRLRRAPRVCLPRAHRREPRARGGDCRHAAVDLQGHGGPGRPGGSDADQRPARVGAICPRARRPAQLFVQAGRAAHTHRPRVPQPAGLG